MAKALKFKRIMKLLPEAAESRHCRHSAKLAVALVERASHVLGLTKTCVPLAAVATAVQCMNNHAHPLTCEDFENLLKQRFPDLTPAQRKIVARAAAVPAGESNWYRWFPAGVESRRGAGEVALRIAAVVHVAEALDSSASGRTGLVAAVDRDGGLELALSDSSEDQDARAALDAAALWNALLPRPVVEVRVDAPEEGALMRPGDRMGEAVTRLVGREVEEFVNRAYGLEYSEDIEFVHEMRVALRRMRSALRVGRKMAGETAAAFRQECKFFAAALGEVRDADVFLAFLRDYAAGAPEKHRPFLRRIKSGREHRRRASFEKLLEAFSSQHYEEMKERHHRFGCVGAESSGVVKMESEYAQRPVVKEGPRLLGKRLRRLEGYGGDIASYDAAEKHAIRISVKRLRYMAEFFAEIYPRGLREVVRPATRLQDQLGEFHDAQVYSGEVLGYLRRSRSAPAGSEEAAAALLRHLGEVRRAAEEKAAGAWRKFMAPKRLTRLYKAIKSPARA